MRHLPFLFWHYWRQLFMLVLVTPVFLAACAISSVAVGPPVYSSLPITAHVVDEDTGQPLEGVIVVAQWPLERSAVVQSMQVGQVMVAEAVTDATGTFHISAWGPKVVSPVDHVPESAPWLLFFKSGYRPKGAGNTTTGLVSAGPILQSRWNGQTITLTKFTGSEKEWVKEVEFIDSSIDFTFRFNDCSWKQIPRTLVIIDQEKKHFKEKGIPNDLHSIEYRDKGFNSPHCGSMQEFLRSYLP